MGYHIEVNTLVRLSNDVDTSTLAPGLKLITTLDRERIIPLRIAMLMIDKDWNFHGYCHVLSCAIKEEKTIAEIEVLTVFTPEVRELYTKEFIAAGKMTGEVK